MLSAGAGAINVYSMVNGLNALLKCVQFSIAREKGGVSSVLSAREREQSMYSPWSMGLMFLCIVRTIFIAHEEGCESSVLSAGAGAINVYSIVNGPNLLVYSAHDFLLPVRRAVRA